MEDKDKRTGWLRELKVGDKVFISGHYRQSIKNIDKITPTGRITIGNTQYDHRGYEIGGDKWHSESLSRWTQEKEDKLVKEIAFNKMCNFLSDKNWKECDFELVKSVYELVKKEME